MDSSSRRSARSRRWQRPRDRIAALLVVFALALTGCADFSTAAAPFTVQPSLTDPMVTPVLPQPLAPSTAPASAPPSSRSSSSSLEDHCTGGPVRPDGPSRHRRVPGGADRTCTSSGRDVGARRRAHDGPHPAGGSRHQTRAGDHDQGSGRQRGRWPARRRGVAVVCRRRTDLRLCHHGDRQSGGQSRAR